MVGPNHGANWVNFDLRGTVEASTSTSQVAGLCDKSCIRIKISTKQQHQLQHHNITITVQIPASWHNSLDLCEAFLKALV